jgi:thermitase
MNRNNFWIHFAIAVVLISMAAVLGQLRRWQWDLRPEGPTETVRTAKSRTPPVRTAEESRPEVLVKFRPGVNHIEVRKLAERLNDRIDDEIESVNGLFFIDDLDDLDPVRVAEQYRSLGQMVEYAEADYEIRLEPPALESYSSNDLVVRDLGVQQPNDPAFQHQWALNNRGQDGGKARADIDALEAWGITKGSDEIVVAVLDTGVDYTHIDLRSNMWTRPDSVPAYSDDEIGSFNDQFGFDVSSRFSDPMDENGHGTHCSGIIGAEGDNEEGIAGVNWNVRIMPLKFLGRGGFGSTSDAIKAINYAIDRKKHGVNVRVINASWGSTMYSRALESAIKAAGENGILFVAAAGNNGTNNDNRPHYPSNYDLPNVVSVAATDRGDQLTSFSNFGVKTVHIAAPGREIESTWLGDSYREASGTSMATPHVAGVAALILAREPNMSVAQLRQRLLAAVDKLPSLAGKVKSGGRLNAAKALGE